MRNLVVAGLLVLVVGLAACGGSEKAINTPVPRTTSVPDGTTTSSVAAPFTITTAPVMSVSSVTQLVTTFYNQYRACVGSNNGVPCASTVVKEYGTKNLESYYTPATGYAYQADPVLCAQNTPTGVQVSGVTTTPNKASGTVTEDFATSITTGFVVVDESDILKINTITCNPPLMAVKQPTGGSGHDNHRRLGNRPRRHVHDLAAAGRRRLRFTIAEYGDPYRQRHDGQHHSGWRRDAADRNSNDDRIDVFHAPHERHHERARRDSHRPHRQHRAER